MTAVVEEISKAARIGDIGDHRYEDLPISVLDDSPGDLDMAGKVASQVFNQWNDLEWRHAFILSLAQHIENQVTHHRAELQEIIGKAHVAVQKRGRRNIVKSYIADVLQELVEKTDTEIPVRRYYRADGTPVSGYDRHQAASMAAAMLMASGKHPANAGQSASYVIRDRSGKVRTEQPDPGHGPKLSKAKGERIIRVKNYGANSGIDDETFNLATVLGANAAQAGSAGNLAKEISYQGTAGEDGTGWFKRLEHASEALHHATNDDRVRVAAAMGKYVGRHGTDVSRVLGPHMRRFTYKYRGYNAPASQWTSVARAGRQENKGGKESIPAFQHKLALSLAQDRKDGGLGAIPTERENELLLQTGNTAPSHGYILDRTGAVKAQSQGYGDDHYVPFNLRDLAALNNGHYVRSRTFGGPTTEDIALAMKTGTKSFSVMSRNGIYDVDFTPQTDKTGKKIGAWAKDTAGDANQVMVYRYGRLLDAIKNGKIKDPETNGDVSLNGRGYELALMGLQRQFPYQIKSVKFTPARDTGTAQEGDRASSAKEDTGYVRPYFLKPGTAKAGYHDPLLGGTKSYDELDAYKLGRARYWSTKKDWESKRTTPQDDQDKKSYGLLHDRGVKGDAPTDLNKPAQGMFRATGGTDFGIPIKSTTATRGAEGENGAPVWGQSETEAYLAHVSALIDHVGAADDTMASLESRLNSSGPDFDDFVDAVRYNRGNIRERLHEDLDELSKHMDGADSTGLSMYSKTVRVGNDNDLAHENARFSTESEDPENIRNSSEWGSYQQWRRLFHPSGSLEQQKKNPYADRAKVRELEQERNSVRGMRLNDVWDSPDPHTDGLTRWQAIENRMARAKGDNEPHKPSDRVIAEPEKSATAVTPDMDEREIEEHNQKFIDQIMRDVGSNGDIDGHGRRKDDLDYS